MTTVRGGAFRKCFVPSLSPGADKKARCGRPCSATGQSVSRTNLNQYGQLVRVIGIAEVGQPAAGLAKRIRGGLSGEFELGKPAEHPAAAAGRYWQRAGASPRVAAGDFQEVAWASPPWSPGVAPSCLGSTW